MITYIYMYIYLYIYLYISINIIQYQYQYQYQYNCVCIYIYIYLYVWLLEIIPPQKKTGSNDPGDGEVQGGTSLGPGTCQPGSTRRGPWGPGRGRCSRGKSMEIWVLSGDFMGFDVDFMEFWSGFCRISFDFIIGFYSFFFSRGMV